MIFSINKDILYAHDVPEKALKTSSTHLFNLKKRSNLVLDFSEEYPKTEVYCIFFDKVYDNIYYYWTPVNIKGNHYPSIFAIHNGEVYFSCFSNGKNSSHFSLDETLPTISAETLSSARFNSLLEKELSKS